MDIVRHPGEDLKEGALAAAVLAQQTHPLALVDVEGQAVQDVVPDGKRFD